MTINRKPPTKRTVVTECENIDIPSTPNMAVSGLHLPIIGSRRRCVVCYERKLDHKAPYGCTAYQLVPDHSILRKTETAT